ncbi:MAG TPA: histidine phosphatase family protein [Ktedonobacterales bacterium]|jgi:broad specificity phosphatase PhoE|nr:histidine phosphatase family protein [Ktedonobacterales bacterium]
MSNTDDPLAPPLVDKDGEDAFLSLKTGGTEVYLIRHADALPGVEEVLPGDYDEQALTAKGRQQAGALAERLRAIPLAAIYSSPILRAIQTAEPTAHTHDIQVQIEPDLREVQLGPIGPDQADASPAAISALLQARLREIAVIALGSGDWSSIPGSEPSAALRSRITAIVDTLAVRHPGQRIALVSHGGAINAYFAAMLGIERDYFFPAANTSVSVMRIKGERKLLFALNDINHLIQAGLFTPA